MNTPTVSLLHATKGRPEKALATMRLWAERAYTPALIEYVLAWEKDDEASTAHFDEQLPIAEVPWFDGSVVAIRGAFGGSAPSWDAACSVSSGALLVQVSDDFEPVVHWDTALLSRLPTGWENEPIVIAVSDGLRRDRLQTMAICTASYAAQKGEFLHAGYRGCFSDDEFTYRAYKDQNAGMCRVIEARELTFTHRHHCAYPEVPEDETYRWQNAPEAYEAGKKLFMERNPIAYGKDAKLWL